VISSPHLSLVRSEDGFTLMELLVGMVIGLVVVGAAFTILEVSLTQSSRITDRVQADQVGRTAMSKIVEELRSTCLAKGFAPIQAKSTSKELVFDDAASSESQINSLNPAPEAYEDHIFLKGETLMDERRASTGGELPSEFTYSKAATKTIVLAKHVTQAANEKKEIQPLFRYYEYAPTASAGTTSTGVTGLKEVGVAEGKELGAVAKEAASVSVAFAVAPENNYTAKGRLVSFENQVTFAFGLPASETTIEDTPCQ
jgi:prepilin-type N-terminal cleavage/methylation domain-containing protein